MTTSTWLNDKFGAIRLHYLIATLAAFLAFICAFISAKVLVFFNGDVGDAHAPHFTGGDMEELGLAFLVPAYRKSKTCKAL